MPKQRTRPGLDLAHLRGCLGTAQRRGFREHHGGHQSPVKADDNVIDNKKLDASRRPGAQAEKRRSLRVQVEVNVPGRALRGRPRIEYAPQAASDADESDPQASSVG